MRESPYLDLLSGQGECQHLGAIGFGWVCRAVAKAGESLAESSLEYWKMRGGWSQVPWVSISLASPASSWRSRLGDAYRKGFGDPISWASWEL